MLTLEALKAREAERVARAIDVQKGFQISQI